jgi:N-acetylglucosaminyl-diphospho-decaprenol L-rhamnosyltransferase
MSKLTTFDIVLVNRNSNQMLRSCLISVKNNLPMSAIMQRVVVVDDCSTDESLLSLPTELPLQIIRNQRRLGYGSSCNRGARGSTADYIIFLNTDTRVDAATFEVALNFISLPDNNHIGILGIKLIRSDGSVARSCSRFPTTKSLLNQSLGLNRLSHRLFPGPGMAEWDHMTSRPVDQVIGAFAITRREAFEKVSGFDEGFFVYYEDLDLSLRMRQHGFINYYLAETSAIHEGGGTSQRYWAESLWFNRIGRIRFARKQLGIAAAVVCAFAALFVEPIVRISQALVKRDVPRARLELKAACWTLATLLRFIKYPPLS